MFLRGELHQFALDRFKRGSADTLAPFNHANAVNGGSNGGGTGGLHIGGVHGFFLQRQIRRKP
jgi:hypothetical protein